uniref:Putative secreted protein n=1 Tax=Panstrongylus lignarius TaxID=156445 RepID=A0A224Y770_9HEMI
MWLFIDAEIWLITVACVLHLVKSLAVVGVSHQIVAKFKNSVIAMVVQFGLTEILHAPIPKLLHFHLS